MSTVYTIGHSTRAIAEFIGILQHVGIGVVADIRTVPKSRHNPQFHSDRLAGSLAAAGIDYRPMPGLGGLRKPAECSINTGWRNTSFRGYADYMQTPSFEEAIEELVALAAERVVAIMCAEAVFWRCHRRLVADALLVRGIVVQHIMGAGAHDPMPVGLVGPGGHDPSDLPGTGADQVADRAIGHHPAGRNLVDHVEDTARERRYRPIPCPTHSTRIGGRVVAAVRRCADEAHGVMWSPLAVAAQSVSNWRST
jgi:hypothetical protein